MFKIVILCIAVACTAANPAIVTKKCKSADSKCMKQNAAVAIPIFAAGIPELGIQPLDPITFKTLDASTPSLKLILRDVTMTGLGKCVPKKIQRDVEKSKLYVRLSCDVEANGKYEMNGRLLVVSLEGKDKLNLKLKQALVAADMEMGTKVGPDGKKYWDIKSFKHSYDLKGDADLVFDNLFPGNAILGRAARDLVANNGKEIILEVAPPIMKILAETIINRVNKYFSQVPYDELSLD